MFTPTQLKQLCETYHLRPSKAYGQNYLIQEKPVLDMLAAGELTADDTVVEVGPGFGVLTLPLADRVGQVYAFEIERKLESYWNEVHEARDTYHETRTKKQDTRYTIHDIRNTIPNTTSTLEQFEHLNNINIIWGNVLHTFPEFSQTLPAGYKVLANLPYHITSHILRTFLEVEHKPERIVVMVQKEVAERICAKPGEMSLLSVAVQYYGLPRIVSVVTKGNFFPSPKVDSAIIAITDIAAKEGSEAFFTVVRAGFSSKRKQVSKNLATELQIDRTVTDAVVAKVCGSATVRAEELSVGMWEEIVKSLDH